MPGFATDRKEPIPVLNDHNIDATTENLQKQVPKTQPVKLEFPIQDQENTKAKSKIIIHQNIVISPSSKTLKELSPQPGCSKDVLNTSSSSLEGLRPLPKARPRVTANTRRKCSSTILTDTPEKQALEERQKSKVNEVKRKVLSSPETKKGQRIKKQKQRRVKKKVENVKKESESSSEEEEFFCLVCMESYDNSKPGEQWMQCSSCRMWSHVECASTGLSDVYICHHCDSD